MKFKIFIGAVILVLLLLIVLQPKILPLLSTITPQQTPVVTSAQVTGTVDTTPSETPTPGIASQLIVTETTPVDPEHVNSLLEDVTVLTSKNGWGVSLFFDNAGAPYLTVENGQTDISQSEGYSGPIKVYAPEGWKANINPVGAKLTFIITNPAGVVETLSLVNTGGKFVQKTED